MSDAAKSRRGRIKDWRETRRIRREKRRHARAERALDASRRDKGAQNWGGPVQGG
jgi:hypothetical protein